jgi:hypothetical protein
VETIGALVDCGAALLVGVVLGYRWTLGPPWHLAAGLVVGLIWAIVYFAVANWVGGAWPDVLDPRLVGLHFIALVFAAAFLGALGAWFGYRKSFGGGLF